jgi:NAD(P)H dehydrogenase (quinone)
MAKVMIVYFSHSGNTRKMAEAFAQVLQAEGCEAVLKKVGEASVDDLRGADGVLLGSACYFGDMAAPMKAFIDESIKLYGKGELQGKPGGAFCSTGSIGGGGELTNTSLINAMLIHGMIVHGFRKGGHFGPLAIGEPDDRVMEEISRYGTQFANLVKKLAD